MEERYYIDQYLADAALQPYVKVVERIKYADIDVDYTSLEGSLTDEGMKFAGEIVRQYSQAKGGLGIISPSSVWVRAIAKEHILEVARAFVDIAKIDRYFGDEETSLADVVYRED